MNTWIKIYDEYSVLYNPLCITCEFKDYCTDEEQEFCFDLNCRYYTLEG